VLQDCIRGPENLPAEPVDSHVTVCPDTKLSELGLSEKDLKAKGLEEFVYFYEKYYFLAKLRHVRYSHWRRADVGECLGATTQRSAFSTTVGGGACSR
jgi:hypothetical protein